MVRTVLSGMVVSGLMCGAWSASAQQASKPAARAQNEAAPSSSGMLPEPAFIAKLANRVDKRSEGTGDPKDGFYLETGHMVTGAGWLSVGPGYRQHVLGDAAMFRASGAVSTRWYKMAQVGLEFPHLRHDSVRAGVQAVWRDAARVNYYGLGSASNELDRSAYRLRTSDVTAYASVGKPVLHLGGRVGWLYAAQPSAMIGRANYPDTIAIFPPSAAPGIQDAASYVHAGLALTSDTRDQPGYPTRGGFYQATVTTFSDMDTGLQSFQRVEGEAAAHAPLVSDWWILSVHGSVALSRVDAGHTVPIYLMPTLGGRNLRGAADYRFHDLDVQSYAVESRWAFFPHIEGAVFAEAGSLAPSVRRLGFSDLKTSYGAGVRLHSRKTTMARLDFARGAEGWRIVFKLNDPFHPTRESSGWRTSAPFAP